MKYNYRRLPQIHTFKRDFGTKRLTKVLIYKLKRIERYLVVILVGTLS